MNKPKSPITGHPITREQAYRGLGNPKRWKAFTEAMYAEFRATSNQSQPKASAAAKAIQKLKAALQS